MLHVQNKELQRGLGQNDTVTLTSTGKNTELHLQRAAMTLYVSIFVILFILRWSSIEWNTYVNLKNFSWLISVGT